MAKKQSPSTLLWFIRRKAYIPLCEIRRRFELDGDDGSFLADEGGASIFVGLPANTCAAIEKLWRQGKIGLELSVEFDCRVLIGVYPMVPVREPLENGHQNGHAHNGHEPSDKQGGTRSQIVKIVEEVLPDGGPPQTVAAGE
jgi:hypothetical protein